MKQSLFKVLGIISMLLLASNLASADVSIQGITTMVTSIKDTVNPGENATYNVSIYCISGPEHVFLSIDDPKEGWTYTFNPAVLNLKTGETGYSNLDITVPSNTTHEVYSHTVRATIYYFGIPAGSTYTIYTTVIQVIPEFPVIAFPIITVLAIMFLLRLYRKQKK